MKKILCAIDDTEASLPAVGYSAALSKAFGAELTLVAINQFIGGYGRAGSSTLLWTNSEKDSLLTKAVAEAQRVGADQAKAISVDSRDPAQAIVIFAEDNGFDHIVVGTGGKGAMQRLVLGSVSRDVAYRAHCPVTVVR